MTAPSTQTLIGIFTGFLLAVLVVIIVHSVRRMLARRIVVLPLSHPFGSGVGNASSSSHEANARVGNLPPDISAPDVFPTSSSHALSIGAGRTRALSAPAAPGVPAMRSVRRNQNSSRRLRVSAPGTSPDALTLRVVRTRQRPRLFSSQHNRHTRASVARSEQFAHIDLNFAPPVPPAAFLIPRFEYEYATFSAPRRSGDADAVGNGNAQCVPYNVDALPAFKPDEENAQTPCGICLECFEDELVSAGACKHMFHTKCIKGWLVKDPAKSCPVCRACFVDVEGHGNVTVNADANPSPISATATRAATVQL